jgi:hypothetical protein
MDNDSGDLLTPDNLELAKGLSPHWLIPVGVHQEWCAWQIPLLL